MVRSSKDHGRFPSVVTVSLAYLEVGRRAGTVGNLSRFMGKDSLGWSFCGASPDDACKPADNLHSDSMAFTKYVPSAAVRFIPVSPSLVQLCTAVIHRGEQKTSVSLHSFRDGLHDCLGLQIHGCGPSPVANAKRVRDVPESVK